MKILELLKNRESPLFFTDDDVEEEKVRAVLEAARWAPSCFNNQPWRYVLVHKLDKTRKDLEKSLYPGNGWAKRAPYLVAVGANPNKDCKLNGLPYYAYDLGLSVMSFVIEAEHQGLRVHQMAGWRENKVKKALNFPESYRVIVLFALGYEGRTDKILDKLQDKIKQKLTHSRTRKPIQELFFKASFGASY